MGWGWSGARQSLSRRTTALGAAQDLSQHPDLHPTAPSTAPSMEPASPLQQALLYPRQHLPPRGAQFPRAGGTGMEQTLHGPLAPSGTAAAPVATSASTPQGKLLSSSSAQPLHPPSSSAPANPKALRGWDLPAAAWERQEKAARRLSPSQVSWCASGTGTLRLDFCEMLNIWSPALQGSLCAAGKLSAIKQHLFLRASRRGGREREKGGKPPPPEEEPRPLLRSQQGFPCRAGCGQLAAATAKTLLRPVCILTLGKEQLPPCSERGLLLDRTQGVRFQHGLGARLLREKRAHAAPRTASPKTET